MPLQLGFFKTGPPEGHRPTIWQNAGLSLPDLYVKDFYGHSTSHGTSSCLKVFSDNTCDFASQFVIVQKNEGGSGLSRSQLAARCHSQPSSVPADDIPKTRPKYFAKVDNLYGHQQLRLQDVSSKVTAIITPWVSTVSWPMLIWICGMLALVLQLYIYLLHL